MLLSIKKSSNKSEAASLNKSLKGWNIFSDTDNDGLSCPFPFSAPDTLNIALALLSNFIPNISPILPITLSGPFLAPTNPLANFFIFSGQSI